MNKKFQRSESALNLRTKQVFYDESQKVFRRNFKQRNFDLGYSAKLPPTFFKERIWRKLGDFHAKDIRQWSLLVVSEISFRWKYKGQGGFVMVLAIV